MSTHGAVGVARHRLDVTLVERLVTVRVAHHLLLGDAVVTGVAAEAVLTVVLLTQQYLTLVTSAPQHVTRPFPMKTRTQCAESYDLP